MLLLLFSWDGIYYVDWFEPAPAFQLSWNILCWMVWSCSCFSVEVEYLTLNGLKLMKLLLLFSWDGISYVEWFEPASAFQLRWNILRWMVEAAPASPSRLYVLLRRVWSCFCFSVEMNILCWMVWSCSCFSVEMEYLTLDGLKLLLLFSWEGISYIEWFEAAPAF